MSFSKISFLVCAALLVFAGSFFYPKWQQSSTEAQISWDASGYYWYLPSIFIYHDLKGQHFKESILKKYSPTPSNEFQQGFLDPVSGNYVMKYTMGTALMELPFFLIAHVLAQPLGYPADGFSLPYQFMIYFGGICFALLGLWYLRKLLLFYYSDKIVAVVLLLLVFGTNYLNYCGIDVGMSHLWLFSLYVFILLNTHFYYQSGKIKYLLRTGALIGLAALTRPPEIISVFIPLLWTMERISKTALKKRLSFVRERWRHFLFAALIGTGILSLQFIYWKYASGRWFIYTYHDQGFSWLHPHVRQYALNYQSGWLTYTPLMFLPLIGLIPFWKKGQNKVAIIFLLLLNYYIVSAWDMWDYGGRAMVQSYPILIFPLAALIRYLFQKKIILILSAPIILLFTYFNLWWTYQAHAGGGLAGSVPSTGAYYWHTILRYNLPLEVQKLRDNKDHFTGKIKNPVLLYEKDFDKNGGAIILNKENEKSAEIIISALKQKPGWIRAQANVAIKRKEWSVWKMTEFIVQFKNGDKVVKTNEIRLQRLLSDYSRKNISIDAKAPEEEFDRIIIFFRNNSDKPCLIHQLTVTGFDGK